ncbi:class I SAM-dependent methyltransferase [Rubritalea tangerina]|uniref:Class I SAM-dependent methyltransferase n=1 Tax=Rubritalea tangerina TaxID=430798 RepID=A0ABW4Z8I8_9BACT
MYQDLEAELHDHFWHAEQEHADELPLLSHFLHHHPGRALEVGCGSGRLLLPLLKQGFDIDGIDTSEEMLALLKKQSNTSNYYLGDATHFNFPHCYAAITIPAFTLQLLSRQDAHALLINLKQHAKPGAALYLTTFIPWAEITDELECDTWNLDKQSPYKNSSLALCHTRHSINRVEQSLHREHHYSIQDARGATTAEYKTEQSLQWYLLPELRSLLNLAGWSLESWHADFQLNLQDSDAAVLTLFATAT